MKKTLRILLILFVSIFVVYLLLPKYLQRVIVYGLTDIYDYKIFHNNKIQKADTIKPWAISKCYNQDNIFKKYQDYFEKLGTVGFLVIQNDSIVHESYFEGHSDSTLSGSFSAGKTIIAMLIGCAIDDGYIKSVDEKVCKYIPEYNNPSNCNLTIKDVLTMSSGLNWEEAYSSPTSVTTKAYYGDDLWNLLKDLKVKEQIGKEFKYLSGNAQLLGFILKKATGKSIAEYLQEKIWKNIGSEHDAFWSLDKKDGMEKSYCCFNGILRDYARFGKLLLANGNWYGKQLISESYMKAMTSSASYLKNPLNNQNVDFYGYQTWILNYKGMKIPYMRGIGGQYVYAIREKNAIVVRLGHKREKGYIGKHTPDAYKYVDIALEVLK